MLGEPQDPVYLGKVPNWRSMAAEIQDTVDLTYL
jgi:hypothetical protein